MEAVPSVGVQYASKYMESEMPRGMRWYTSEQPEHGVVELSYGETDNEVKPILIPEDEKEEEMVAECTFVGEVEHPHFDKIVQNAMQGYKIKRQPKK